MSHPVSAGRATCEAERSRGTVSHAAFVGVCALCFAVSATATIAGSASMAAMGAMPMPGGWTLSAAWTRMCGQTWADVTASFMGMWSVMTVAMMLPSLMPMLSRYREAVGGIGPMRATRLGLLTVLVCVGYYFVWTVVGIVVFALGAALAALVVQVPALARVVPTAVGLVVLSAGVLQFTAWKAHQLECCRAAPGHCGSSPAEACVGAVAALRHGLRLGVHCARCCAGLTAILLVVGVMDLRTMAIVTTAITGERLAPRGECVARAVGMVLVGVGGVLIVRAIVSG
jgi:predicted metal-binding membrane protein